MHKGKSIKQFFISLIFILIGSIIATGCGKAQTANIEMITTEEIITITEANTEMEEETAYVSEDSKTDTQIPSENMIYIELSEEQWEQYETVIADLASEWTDIYETDTWGVCDINQDNVPELVVKREDILSIYMLQNDVWIEIYSANHSTLLENGIIRNYLHEAKSELYTFYMFDEEAGCYQELVTLSRNDVSEYQYQIYDENDEYDVQQADALEAVTMQEWFEQLDIYQAYSKAQIAFYEVPGNKKEVHYDTEEEAYHAFLNGMCSVKFSENYTDDIGSEKPYFNMEAAYYLYDIIDAMNNEPMDSDSRYINYGTDISYAIIDCGNDGRDDLALRITKYVGIDELTTTYILQYKNQQLYLCYGIVGWSRNRYTINSYGYIWQEGSSGADHQSGSEMVVDAEGARHIVGEWEVCSYSFSFYNNTSVVTHFLEIVSEWKENYVKRDEDDVHPLDGLGIQIDIVDGIVYFSYSGSINSKNIENHQSFIQKCEAEGIQFYTDEEKEDLYIAYREKLGVAACAEDKEEPEWIDVYTTFVE